MAIALNRSRQVPADETPAFGGIAERFRRAGDLERAVALCRDGLKKFPDHLSARVTLGWSLLDLGRYDEAQVELEQALKRAPDNLAAIRGLAELHERAENAVVVPMEEHEAADAAAALELARVMETEKAPSAPAEPTKRAKSQPAPEPPPAKAKHEPHVEPEPPRAAPAHKHQSSGPSVFAQPMLAHGAEKSEPRAAKPEPRPAKPEPRLAKPEPPSLEALAAEFEAPSDPVAVEPREPQPSAVVEPVRVLDNRGQEVPDLTRAAATAKAPVEPAPAATSIPNLVDELVTPADAAMTQPAEVIDDFIPPPAAAMSVPEPIVDHAPPAELPVVDFAPDADALLSSAAFLSATDLDPAASAQIQSPDVEHAALLAAEEFTAAAELHPQPELTESLASAPSDALLDLAPASMLGSEHLAMASEAHPEPDVNELLAQLAQEEDTAALSSSMIAAEPAAPIEAHPQPDVADFRAQFAPDQAAETAHTSVFAADALAAAPEPHPEPQIADVAAPPAVIAAAAFEPEPAWPSATQDFVAALEATHFEPAALPEPEPAGEPFALSAEPPAALVADNFALESEPVAAIEAAADQQSMLDQAHPEPAASGARIGPAQMLDFEAPKATPAPPPLVVTPTPPAPVAAPVVPAPKAVSALLKKKNRNVAVLEKMLRRIASRRLELASEYQLS